MDKMIVSLENKKVVIDNMNGIYLMEFDGFFPSSLPRSIEYNGIVWKIAEEWLFAEGNEKRPVINVIYQPYNWVEGDWVFQIIYNIVELTFEECENRWWGKK